MPQTVEAIGEVELGCLQPRAASPDVGQGGRAHRALLVPHQDRFADDRDRRVVEFLRAALRLRIDRERERPEDQTDQDIIMKETAQFLGSEPENIRQ